MAETTFQCYDDLKIHSTREKVQPIVEWTLYGHFNPLEQIPGVNVFFRNAGITRREQFSRLFSLF